MVSASSVLRWSARAIAALTGRGLPEALNVNVALNRSRGFERHVNDGQIVAQCVVNLASHAVALVRGGELCDFNSFGSCISVLTE